MNNLFVMLYFFLSMLNADLKQDLASLETHLISFAKILPEPVDIPEPTMDPIPRTEYIQWPKADPSKFYAGTKVKVNGSFQDLEVFLKDKPKDYMIPLGTEIRPAGYLDESVIIGEKSYALWKLSGFFEPFTAIDEDDYTKFDVGVEIAIARPKNDITLKVKADNKIDGVEYYIDEDDRLLCVRSLKKGITKSDFTKFTGSIAFNNAIEDFKEADDEDDEDEEEE